MVIFSPWKRHLWDCFPEKEKENNIFPLPSTYVLYIFGHTLTCLGRGRNFPSLFRLIRLEIAHLPSNPNPSPTVHVFWVCSAVAPLFFTAIFCHDGRSLPSLFLLLLFWENRLWLQKRRRRRHEITLRRGNQHWHQKATYYCLKQSYFLEKSSYSIWSFMRWKGETVGNRPPISRFVESVFDWVMHSILKALP